MSTRQVDSIQVQRRADDRVLVLSFQGGDRGAYDDIYRRYGPMAERICRRYLLNPHDAEEAAQETMLRVLRSLPTFNGRYALRAWVARIATNVCLDQIRHTGRRNGGEELNEVVPEPVNGNGNGSNGDPSEVLEQVARREEIRAHLARLPERHRIALVLREVEGLGHREIAVILHTTPARVKALLHRARRGFRMTWADGERPLAAFLPVAAVTGWLRRLVGRVQEVGASGSASSPTVTTLATTGGDHLSSAVAAVVLAGSIGLSAGTAPPSVAEEPRSEPALAAPAVVEPRASDETGRARRGSVEDPAKRRRGAADATAVVAPVAAPEAETAAAEAKAKEAQLPEPAPVETVRPQPAVPAGFTFGFTSDWDAVEPCDCVDSPQVSEQQITSVEGELASFSSRVQGGVIRDRDGQLGWPVTLSQSGSATEHVLELTVHTEEGDHIYRATGSQVSKGRTSWGGWTYGFSGTYRWEGGPEGATLLPKRGNYAASLTFALREGRLVDATFSLTNGSYGE